MTQSIEKQSKAFLFPFLDPNSNIQGKLEGSCIAQ